MIQTRHADKTTSLEVKIGTAKEKDPNVNLANIEE